MDRVIRAGTIPYYTQNDTIRMLFMQPSDPRYGGPDFQIAKGKVDPEDATIESAALREAGEELGLYKSNIINIQCLGEFLGYTTVYIAKIKDPDMFGVPDFETGATRWMTPEEFSITGRDIHRPIIEEAASLIKQSNSAQETT